MFNLEDFREYPTLFPFVEKLNKYLKKEKSEKVSQIIEDINSFLQEKQLIIPITYLYSVLAEKDISYISKDIINDVIPFLDSDENKLRLNTIIILGFYLLEDSGVIDEFISKFIEMLDHKSDEIVENVYYFLQRISESKPKILCEYKSAFLEHLKTDSRENNQLTLLKFIEPCGDFDFDDLYRFRAVSLRLISQYKDKIEHRFISDLISKLAQLFPEMQEDILDYDRTEELSDKLEKLFIMKKYDFSKISKEKRIDLKTFLQERKRSSLNKAKITFYLRISDSDQIFYYEIEKSKFTEFFNSENKISGDVIKKKFSKLIDNDTELDLFMNTLIKLKIIKGYFSDLYYFYPYAYLREDISIELQEKGLIKIDKYNYIPPEYLREIIDDVSQSMKTILLLGKNGKVYFSQKKINQTVNKEAAKTNAIDIKAYKKRLTEKDYSKLIENLPKDYLSRFNEGTQYLTNLGLTNVRKEIENSNIIGYFSISDSATKLKIGKKILSNILKEYIDMRSGVFDKDKNNFYYSKFLNEKINHINQIRNEEEKTQSIDKLATQLNIDKDVIFSKLEENLRLIGEEIKKKSEIDINEYIDKTGMDYEGFLNYIQDLNLDYFKKGDLLIIDQERIDQAKAEIKMKLLERANEEDFIEFNDLDLTQNIIQELLYGLLEEKKIVGLFYNDGEKSRFYTRKGIENLMLENQHFFSFHDFFSEKTLTESELQFLRTILDESMKAKRLIGTFDEENLIFSSKEVLFAQNYNTIVSEFQNLIDGYIEHFKSEFEKIKKILIKRDETILPQEIIIIQEIIKQVNYNYVHWRSGIDAFVRNANINLLKKQGLTLKKYKTMKTSLDGQRDVKLFEEDPEVIVLLDKFKEWIKIYNTIELKYGNVIFYQKRLSRNPENEEDIKRLNDLLIQLKLIEG